MTNQVDRKRGEPHPGHTDRNQCPCVDQAAMEYSEDEAKMWTTDRAGAHHWGLDGESSPFKGRVVAKAWAAAFEPDVRQDVSRALASRPEGVCWFWWANCPAPMADANETPERLFLRWMEWKEAQYRGTLPDLMWRWALGFSS